MPSPMERYVFFNNAADREAVRAAGARATAHGARVVELLPKAVLIDVDVHKVPDIAAALTNWQFTPDRRQVRERRLAPARRGLASSASALAAA